MRSLKTVFLLSTILLFPACSKADPTGNVSTADREAIEQIVYDYIMDNPEIIREAMVALEAKEDWASINALRNEIYNDKRDVVIGPANAKVTIVEFFDYNCTFCKRTTDWIVDVIKENPNDVRVIFKELPVLDGRTQTSRLAAKAAMAAHRQGKYLDMHVALMEARGLSSEKIDTIAKENGVDVAKMRADMDDPKLIKYVEDQMRIGQQLRPLTGTPFFIIGDDFVSGANVGRLDELLDKALNG